MIQDIRLHGFVADRGERYEYFANVIGPGLNVRFFFEQTEDARGRRDRFFLGENEFALYPNLIFHRGNGGAFCEYMLGMRRPVKDLLKPEARNRLVMYGARYDQEGDHIVFSNETTGKVSYDRLFGDGHAFANYRFFITGDIQGDLKTVQETILRVSGKFLKRSELSFDIGGSDLAWELYREIDIPRWTLFLIKLIDRCALEYHRKFVEFYSGGKAISLEEKKILDSLARLNRLGTAERERLELDAVYKHTENRSLIDDYKQVLIARCRRDQNASIAEAKRRRLRTLGEKRRIPAPLFDKLDGFLKPLQEEYELPACLTEARRCLTEIFAEPRPGRILAVEELAGLLKARLEALEQHFGGFEDLLSEVKTAYKADEGEKAELFNAVVAHLERFESAYGIVNSVALIDDYDLGEEKLYLLARAVAIFENVRPGLLDEMIFRSLDKHRYLNLYGRRRLERLKEGIAAMISGEQPPDEIAAAILKINEELRLRRALEGQLRERLKNSYRDPLGRQEQEFLRLEISRNIIDLRLTADLIPHDLFASALLSIREEYLYLDELLPQIISNKDKQLRDDFLENSALDRFRTEELEQQYLRSHKLSPDALDWFGGYNDQDCGLRIQHTRRITKYCPIRAKDISLLQAQSR